MSAHHAKGAGSTRLVGIVFPAGKWAGGRASHLPRPFEPHGFSDMHFDVLAVPAERFAAWIEATRNRAQPSILGATLPWPGRA
jgi:hypothetical protein